MFDTAAETAKALGVTNLRAADRARNYAYLFQMGVGVVSANSTATITKKISIGGALVVRATTGDIHDGSGVAVTAKQVRVAFSINQTGPWQSDPVPWNAIVGTGQYPAYWPFPPVIPAGADVSVTVYNDSSSAVTVPGIVLWGHILGNNV